RAPSGGHLMSDMYTPRSISTCSVVARRFPSRSDSWAWITFQETCVGVSDRSRLRRLPCALRSIKPKHAKPKARLLTCWPAVVPLRNGMRHLDARFGADRALGGSSFISARLDHRGHLAHQSDIHRLAFGEQAGG